MQVLCCTAKHETLRNIGKFPFDPWNSVAHIGAYNIFWQNPVQMWIINTNNCSRRFRNRFEYHFPIIQWHGNKSVVVLVVRHVQWALSSIDIRQRHNPESTSVNCQIEIPCYGNLSHSRFE